MKNVPDLWWDLNFTCLVHKDKTTLECVPDCKSLTRDIIIIETDHPDYPVIWERTYIETYEELMLEAEAFIKDVKEGRRSFYEEAKKYEANTKQNI